MNFELRIALSYLLPTRRHWSRSLLSSLSILAISAVVWVVMVFLSVSSGLQRIWVGKLLALDAPIHIRPTKLYFETRTPAGGLFAEKWLKSCAPTSPANGEVADANGEVAAQDLDNGIESDSEDPVVGLKTLLNALVGNHYALFTTGYANTQVRVMKSGPSQQLQPERVFHQLSLIAPTVWRPELLRALDSIPAGEWKGILQRWFGHTRRPNARCGKSLLRTLQIRQLSTPANGWSLPKTAWPQCGQVRGVFLRGDLHICQNSDQHPQIDLSGPPVAATFTGDGIQIAGTSENCRRVLLHKTLFDAHLNGQIRPTSADQLTFQLNAAVQGHRVCAEGQLRDLDIARVELESPLTGSQLLAQALPDAGGYGGIADQRGADSSDLHPVLLPRQFWQNGARVGDFALMESSVQTPAGPEVEPICALVCGFFDPGIMPLGGRLVLTDFQSAQLVHEGLPQAEAERHTAIRVFCPHREAARIAGECRAGLKRANLDALWSVQSFEEFDQIRDLIDQLKSDQTLLTLLAVMIIGVACSNIISMLLLLVVEKRQEIAILRSLGATSGSIARIFGLCGLITGSLGCLLGAMLAWGTLRHIDFLVALISKAQGRQLFHPLYYGENLPGELTGQAVVFTLIATALLSLLAGLLPALQAARLHPSRLLRNL